MNKKLLFLVLFTACSTSQVSYKIQTGEILPIRLPAGESNDLSCNEKLHPFIVKDGNLIFIIAEGYVPKTSNYKCHLSSGLFKKTDITILVEPFSFGNETLTVDPSKVILSDSDKERTQEEHKLTSSLYKKSNKEPYFDGPFFIPQDKITSIYGTARLFNREVASYHSGTDFRKASGAKVVAINKGKVVLAKNLFYLGNAIIIDHGLSIFSIYGHLSKIMVKEGDIVNREDLLGLAGSTGRSTGPHLHLGVMVNETLVSAIELKKLDNL